MGILRAKHRLQFRCLSVQMKRGSEGTAWYPQRASTGYSLSSKHRSQRHGRRPTKVGWVSGRKGTSEVAQACLPRLLPPRSNAHHVHVAVWRLRIRYCLTDRLGYLSNASLPRATRLISLIIVRRSGAHARNVSRAIPISSTSGDAGRKQLGLKRRAALNCHSETLITLLLSLSRATVNTTIWITEAVTEATAATAAAATCRCAQYVDMIGGNELRDHAHSTNDR